LNTAIDHFQQAYQQFHEQDFSQAQWDKTVDLRDHARAQAAQPVELEGLERNDREDELESWLTERNLEDSWELAPILVNMGYQTNDLDELERDYPKPQLGVVVEWLCSLFTIFSLLEEINQGTTRIGEIVKSLKSYTYLDQAPVQEVDVHEGLDNTLIMLRSKLKTGITLERNYAEGMPKVMAYGGELNQVWTNIIANAVDAMDGQGTIKISTKQVEKWIHIEIEDTGPGIPEDVRQKLFSPFFTTKPMGKGTGLGLNISFNIIQKHKGYIDVDSKPGQTRFSVRLPINFEQVE
jgi:signal transduction histidine kinase